MDLRDYVRVLRKSWALILAVTVVGVALGVGLTLATTKLYQANVQVFVSTNSAVNTNVNQSNSFTSSRVQTYTHFATTPKVLALVIADKNNKALTADTRSLMARAVGKLTEAALKGKISSDAPQDETLINLHVTDENPVYAAAIANSLGRAFIQIVPQTEQTIPLQSVSPNGATKTTNVPAVKLTVIQPATIPGTPIKPNKIVNIGLGLVLGLVIGIGVAVVREILDNTVKSAHDFEELGIPLLAQVAFDRRAPRSPIAFRSDAHSPRSEAYRQLRTNLQFVDVDHPPRIIAITSAVPGEGKTTTAINLAAALAEAGARVCLVEADLRRPSIAKTLGLVSDVGFTTVVIGKAPVETVLQNAGRNLAVLTCGPIPPNPSELLISQHAKQVILDIAEKVDYTIIDTPPLLPVTDGAEIATIADATLMVHRAAKTTRDQAIRSIAALEKVGRRPVGVILNMITRSAGGRYEYEYGYYYSAYRPRTQEETNKENGKDRKARKADKGEKAESADKLAKAQKAEKGEKVAKVAKADKSSRGERAAAASSVATLETDELPVSTAESADSSAATASLAPAADEPKSRRARHRGARRAAEAAKAAAATAADTDSFSPVSANGTISPAEPEQVPADATPAQPTGATGEHDVSVDDGGYDLADEDFADEDYPSYLDDEDEYSSNAPALADDDTAEFGAVEIDGQEELPLNERVNGRTLDDAFGVRGDDRR